MIKQKLLFVEKQLKTKLEGIRASHKHRGNSGSVAESVVRQFLCEYLPPSNRVGEGEIIDLEENISTQLDIIITNEYHPYLNDLKEPGLFIIEGVACAGEVKTNLNSKDIDTLIQSCITYKTLTPVIPKGVSVIGELEDLNRFINHRPYFIFAFESQLTLDTISDKLIKYYAENGTPIYKQIDGVFCLDRGSLINFGEGGGSLKMVTKNNEVAKGITIARNGDNGVLLDLMSWLSTSIPKYALPKSPLTKYLLANQRP